MAGVKDRQPRHRFFQASFREVQRAVEEKAEKHGVPVVYADPKKTSKPCQVHGTPITYDDGSRTGRCSTGEEPWHRDVATCWNPLLKALRGDGGSAPCPVGLNVDGSAVPFRSTATHDPTGMPKSLRAGRKSLDAASEHKLMRMSA